MDDNISQQVKSLMAREFEIDLKEEETLSEEQIFDLLADRIAYMIEYRLDFLLSLMYRLDILEKHINAALHPASPDPANIALARLVWERQKQRMLTKQQYKQGKIEDWEDFEL